MTIGKDFVDRRNNNVKQSLHYYFSVYTACMQKEQVHNHVMKYRKEAGFTQQDLADQISVSRQTIISIEKGKYTPSVLLALKISTVLSKDVQEIFYIDTQ